MHPESGKVYAHGTRDHGVLGLSDDPDVRGRKQVRPMLIEEFVRLNKTIEWISTKHQHNVAITSIYKYYNSQ